jgi:tyrosine decarboxylase/aspartate 1-decarboxylase
MNPINNLDKQKNILKNLEKYRKKDFTFSSGHILGSMCTQPHPIAKKAYMKFLETNLGDPDLFPGTSEIESKYIQFVSKMLNAPKNHMGLIGSGGTEGNITAMWLAKQLSGKKEILVPENAHFSFEKIASLMDMKLVSIPLNDDYCTKVSCVKEKINDNTAAVVGIAGSTELGTIDSISKLNNICKENNVFLHVDAAFGGFVIPFLKKLGYDVPNFDFSLSAVKTISVDAHKMGYSAIPLGTLIIRNKEQVKSISVESHCVSSEKQAGILGTRSGGPVVAAYAVTKFLGEDGYKKLVQQCMNVTCYTMERIHEIGLNLAVKPTMNVLGIKLRNPSKVIKKLTDYGWKVNEMRRISCLRIVLMPHVTEKVVDRFIPVLKRSCTEAGEL